MKFTGPVNPIKRLYKPDRRPAPPDTGRKEEKESAKIFTSPLAKGKAIDMRDALITGTILAHECDKIVTKNVEHIAQIG